MRLLRHFFIALGIVAVFFVGLMIRHWDTTTTIVSNMTALGEGSQEAELLKGPEDVLDYLARHGETASLVVFDLDDAENGVFWQADAPRPVAGLTKVFVLAEYARQVASGTADADAPVDLADLQRHYLPRTNDTAHDRIADRFADVGALTMDDAVAAMMTDNYPAAMDFLIQRLGGPDLATVPGHFGLDRTHGPVPTSGIFLSWHNHTMTTTPAERVAAYQAMDAAQYTTHAYALASTLADDEAFHRTEVDQLAAQGTGLSIKAQRDLARATYPRGTAAAYADFFASVAGQGALDPAVQGPLRLHLEQPVQPDSTAPPVAFVGVQGGGFPGLISFVGYVRTPEGRGRVVACFLDDVPLAVFYHLTQSGLDQAFVLQLLMDDTFFEAAQGQLNTSANPT